MRTDSKDGVRTYSTDKGSRESKDRVRTDSTDTGSRESKERVRTDSKDRVRQTLRTKGVETVKTEWNRQ